MSESQQHNPEALDAAISQRLAKLRSRPVELGSLQKAIEREIPRQKNHSLLHLLAIRPLRAVAAMLTVGVTIAAIVLATASSPAIASSQELLRLHESVISQVQQTPGDSSEEIARAAINGQWPAKAASGESCPRGAQMPCCVHRLGGSQATCVLLSIDGVPVTLAAADAVEVRMPAMEKVTQRGVTFHVQNARNINMVMTERGGKWYCLMGNLPTERLMTFWTGVVN